MILYLISIKKALHVFWQKNPALLYGSIALMSVAMALGGGWVFLIPLALLAASLSLKRVFLTLLFVGAFFTYVKLGHQFPKLPEEGVLGTAYFDITSLASTTTHFGKRWDYKGRVVSFIPDAPSDDGAKNIPCRVGIADRENVRLPPANCSYCIHGKLLEPSSGNFLLRLDKSEPWLPIARSWSIAELRLRAKEALSRYIRSHVRSERSSEFLAGIATGNFEDRMMNFSFARFGVQHIMAISGFHFAILAGIIGLLLRLIMSIKVAAIFLLMFLTGYMLFLGPAPSIVRAWAACSVGIAGLLLHKRAGALNYLGVAILFILLLDPLMARNLGFQLSVGTTASILLFYPLADKFLERIFRKRTLSEALQMPYLDQLGYIVMVLFRRALALEIAVNAVALPLALFYFLKLPWLGFIWNIFFPFLVSISLFLLIVGLIVGVIPPLGHLVHGLNSYYTDLMLSVLYNPSTVFDYQIRVNAFPLSVLVLYLTLIFAIGIISYSFLEKEA